MKWRLWGLILLCMGATVADALTQAGWRPAPTPLFTKWASDVDPRNCWPEYPRPQMKRALWQSLNGLWEYSVTAKSANSIGEIDGQILVPFAYESSLSGVGKRIDENHVLWYRRQFVLPESWRGQRLLLHFGAVDWRCRVFVNDIEVGDHTGGYDPFSFDVTDALKPGSEQEVVVKVWDPTSDHGQARGKQIRNPHGIHYTPVTGIWQTVWLEPVPKASISSVRITPNARASLISVVGTSSNSGARIRYTIAFDGEPVATGEGGANAATEIVVPNKRLWTPAEPNLYDVRCELIVDDQVTDAVECYFGLRDIRVGPDASGITRVFLNDSPITMIGLLDQGYWPDGLYTAPTFEALKFDLDLTKRLGFNTVRKHVKTEPAVWYRLCDEMGLIVWQDMPSAWHPTEGPTPEVAKQFEAEWKAIMDALYPFPSLVMWVPFNEGWGQYDTVRVTEWTMAYDPSRIVNSASGWTDFGAGHVNDIHIYPGPGAPKKEAKRAGILGEFGGLGFPIEGHLWNKAGNWGYVSYKTSTELTDAAIELLRQSHPLLGQPGLCALIYTQTTDVEIEVNGIITYDREKLKFDEPRLSAAIRELYTTPPVLDVLLPTSAEDAQDWHFTTTYPGDDWFKPGVLRSHWQSGPGGFGTRQTPNTTVRTEWSTSDLWIAREFELSGPVAPDGEVYLSIYHDEDAEVYLDGKLVAQLKGYTTGYKPVPVVLDGPLVPGRHTLAIHVRQTTGGQYIDAGLIQIRAAKE